MANITLTSTAIQDNALNSIIKRINFNRANEIPPKLPLTVKAYAQDWWNGLLDSFIYQEHKKPSFDAIQQKWDNLTQSERDQIKSILNVS